MTATPVIGTHDPQIHTTCIICSHTIPLATAVAGSLYADGSQAFACSTHLDNRTQWITTWALFDAHEAFGNSARPIVQQLMEQLA